MCKSIEEPMEKLKSLNLQICFDTNFSKNPIQIEFNSEIIDLKKGKTFFDLNVNKIDQNFEINFLGYVHEDSEQKVIVNIYYHNKKIDTSSLCYFQMKNNRYVENVLLKKCNEICFNGKLFIKFFKEWFECNILAGSNLSLTEETFIDWSVNYKKKQIKIKDADIFCIGDSFTLGEGVDKKDNWPAILNSKLKVNVENIGISGLSAEGCFINTKYLLSTYSNKNFSKKILICLLPTRFRKNYKFKFLNYYGHYQISFHKIQNNLNIPKVYKNAMEKIRKFKLTDNEYTKKNWVKSCQQILNICNKKEIKCFLSTWDEEMYKYIPNYVRLPIFPKLTPFGERGTDGIHPHKKHYELFVENILPYIQ